MEVEILERCTSTVGWQELHINLTTSFTDPTIQATNKQKFDIHNECPLKNIGWKIPLLSLFWVLGPRLRGMNFTVRLSGPKKVAQISAKAKSG